MAKKKRGVYSPLSRRPKPVTIDHRDIETLTKLIKPMVRDIAKAAFTEYARAHGCKPENEVLEWTRFNRILQKYL